MAQSALFLVQDMVSAARIASLSTDVSSLVRTILVHASEAGLSLEACGTSRDELLGLVQRGLVSEEIVRLTALRLELAGGRRLDSLQEAAALALLDCETGHDSRAVAADMADHFAAELCTKMDEESAFRPTIETYSMEVQEVDVGGESARREANLSPEDMAALDRHSADAICQHDPFVRASVLDERGRPWGIFVPIGHPIPSYEEVVGRFGGEAVELADADVEDITPPRRTLPPPLPAGIRSDRNNQAAGHRPLQA